MKTYGIEDKRGYDPESTEDVYRKKRARQKNKKIINQQHSEYLKERAENKKKKEYLENLEEWYEKNQ